MPFVCRAFTLVALFTVLLVPSTRGQPVPKAEDVAALREKFQTEREEALKAKFPVETLARADDLAKRGEAVLKENPAAAGYFRDARWQLRIFQSACRNTSFASSANRGAHADRVNSSRTVRTERGSLRTRDSTVKIWDLGTARSRHVSRASRPTGRPDEGWDVDRGH